MHFTGPTRAELLALLRSDAPEDHVPIMLGRYEIEACVSVVNGRWTLQRMVIDEDKATAEGRRRMAAGLPWMPEMRGQFLEPGKMLAEADSASGLADRIEIARFRFLR